jgi:hypothetical protein
MAGKYGSSSLVFLVDGFDFLASKLTSLSLKITSITEETDGLGDNSQIFSPVWKQRAAVTQGRGFFDTAANSIHDAMATKLGATPQDTPRVFCIGIMGNTVGAVFYGIVGAFSVAYEAVVEMSKLTKANAEHLIDGLVDRGQIVQPLATFTANWNTHTLGTPVDYTTDPSQYTIPITSNSAASPSVVTTPVPHGLVTNQVVLISGVVGSNADINGQRIVTVISPTTFSVPIDASSHAGAGGSFVWASSVNGGAGYQEVTAFTLFTGYVGKIRHSVDETIYTDLAVFTNVTTSQKAQCVVVAPGTTVNRYLCHDGAVTGAGSLGALSGFCRR